MIVRIVSWNMQAGFGYDSARHDRAWHYLRAMDPDVALLQEAVTPAWAADHWSVVAHRKYEARPGRADVPWGSTIIAKHGVLAPLEPDSDSPWLRELRGCATVARLDGDDPTWFASIHSNAYPLSAERLAARPTDGLRRCDDADTWESS